ncbi:1,5-anhydro-D-fructose reductase [Paenibacillus konkukensis]|uniref:1,5-anhydro-D-fructose reductase n=1 Tax=Paenibacillus konkukensis TaxID=2020716 RepID=A0ABY4RJK4_9BACL|nr:Gfo/Idh/MocA family oxidoreductase [Paenibacillus konkukensis]UQZ82397.1 1,5-anhydro-D-fructose reductase [Paenibacillus konkukensis]
MRELNVALIGYNFMGKAHSYAIGNAAFFFPQEVKPVKKVIAGRNEPGLKRAAEQFGWQEYTTDWREAVGRSDIDIVCIATPTSSHKEIAVAAAKAGKHVLCEKPLGMNAGEARQMWEAAHQAGVIHMIGHNYRRVPAIALAKKLIDDGKLGDIYHFRGVYLQDWLSDPAAPMSWRLDKRIAGAGAHGDLNAHLIDLARYLVGDMERVVGMEKTFVTRRTKALGDKPPHGEENEEADRLEDVTVDDAAAFLARFKNGALGTFEASRMAGGRKNHERIEINGSKGSLAFHFERMNELEFWSREDDPKTQGYRTILATEEVHPYMQAWWPPGHPLGYQNTFVNQFADLIRAILAGEQVQPNFYDGWMCNLVLDAVSRSVQSLTWEHAEPAAAELHETAGR